MTDTKALTVLDSKTLMEDAAIGMKAIDTQDIRPPQILLVQKSSDLSLMKDVNQQKPDFGQYFNSGKLEIVDSFECYLVFAAKVDWYDKRAQDESKAMKQKYRTIGVMADDFTLFAMDFKAGAMWALTPLFSNAAANKRPYWSIRVRIESKKMSNKQGEWATPVVRILGAEDNLETYKLLRSFAKQFDSMKPQRMDDEEQPDDHEEDLLAAPTEKEIAQGNTQVVEPDDVPF